MESVIRDSSSLGWDAKVTNGIDIFMEYEGHMQEVKTICNGLKGP